MQSKEIVPKLDKTIQTCYWAVVIALSILFGMSEIYGVLETERGLATNRAWVGPVLLGLFVIGASGLLFFFPIWAIRGELGKRLSGALLSVIVIGLSPTVALLLLDAVLLLAKKRTYGIPIF